MQLNFLVRGTAAAAMAAALVAGSVVAAPAAHAQNPFQRGPAPTESLLEAPSGPFATSSVSVSSLVPGFGGGQIYFPTTTSVGTFGGVAISPGFTATWSSIDWLGPFLASHGFVVIGINTNSRFDLPSSRASQLLAALDYLTDNSSVRNRVDPDRLAVAGHSMGGGGAIEAANRRPSLRAAVPLTPWHTTKSWGGLDVGTLIIGGENDTIAPVSSHSILFYNSIPASSEKAYAELNNEGHLFPTARNIETGKFMVSWLKRFVDFDTRYEQFLCPAPDAGPFQPLSDYRDTCPHTV